MKAHHLYELKNRLERVRRVGCAEITRDELLEWYDQARLSKSVWRDIRDQWAEMEPSEKHPLLVGDSDPVYVLAWGEGLDPDPEVSWLKHVSHKAA